MKRKIIFVLAFAAFFSNQELYDKSVNASEEAGKEAIQNTELRCEEHDALERDCYLCHPELRESGRLWCNDHQRYEDRCWLCHPDKRDMKRPFCEKHFLYLDECFLCDPKLKTKLSAVPSGVDTFHSSSPKTPDSTQMKCEEHNINEEECGICHPELVNQLEPGQGLKVRFVSSDAASKAGIETERPRVLPVNNGVDCYAEIAFNQNKLVEVTTTVDGIIQGVEVDLGHRVKEGQVLARIWSASIGEAVSKAVLGHQNVFRERKLHAEHVSAEKDLQEAEADYQNTYQHLKILGFDDRQIEGLAAAAQPMEMAVLEIRAPFAGEIIERKAVRGALAEAGKSLFTLADRSIMWAMINIPEKDLTRIHLEDQVELRIDALSGQTFMGRLTWISAQVDAHTRMAKARAEIADPQNALLSQMFARARILLSHSEKAVVVSQTAIQCIAGKQFVFVKLDEDLYEVRCVQISAKQNGSVEIIKGVGADESVVVVGSFIAKSQLLISRLGAGCTD